MNIEKQLVIQNKLGLHARAATKLVQLASQYDSEILLACDGKKANANSVMGLLLLAGAQGTSISVSCAGNDAEDAMLAIEDLITAKFEETE